jgi:hypothetical protein
MLMRLIIGILSAIAALVLVLKVVDYLSRHVERLRAECKRVIRGKFHSRREEQLASLLAGVGLEPTQLTAARALWQEVAKILDVPPGVLRPTDRVHDLVTVSRDELPDVPERVWRKAGLPLADSFRVGEYDLLEVFEGSTSARKLESDSVVPSPPPRSEHDWIEFLLTLDLGSLVSLAARASQRY